MMHKRIAHILLCLSLVLALTVPALAVQAPEPICEAELHIDGADAGFNGTMYFDGTTHVPFAVTVQALRPDAQVVCENGRYTATAEDFTMTAKAGESYLVVNDRYLYIPDTILTSAEGEAMVPVRILCRALGVGVEWDGKVNLNTQGAVPLKEEDRPYTDKEIDLISRVITHEAGNQSLEGKIAVGDVILHRVESKGLGFADTVSGVLYQKNQFTGATNCTPNAQSIIAAKLAADGAEVVPGAYWFNGVNGHVFSFAKRLYVIGDHAFYGRK